MVEVNTEKFSFSRLLMVTLLVVTTALMFGVGTWYYMSQESAADLADAERQIEELRTEKKNGDINPEMETKNWKKYTDPKGRFSLRYPEGWKYVESKDKDTVKGIAASWFSEDSVVFYSESKKIALSLNMGELLGRGGVCTKYSALYKPTVVEKMLKLEKQSYKYETVTNDEYCGGTGTKLNGYQASVENFSEQGTKYFIHMEASESTDAAAVEALEYFVKVSETLTFK